MQEQTQQTERHTSNTQRLTQAIARRYVQALGGRCNRTGFGSELRVQLAGCEYFTDSPADAIGTARCIATAHSHVGGRLEAAEAVLTQELRQGALIPETVFLPSPEFVDHNTHEEDEAGEEGDGDHMGLTWTEVQS